MRYDVVVAGASFAGLVAATSIRGRVALIEKGDVGAGQTSACGTTLDLVEKLGLEASIEEIHDEGVMHTHHGVIRFPLPYRFCTFDYRTFCRLLLDRFDGELVHASALAATAHGVRTDRGDVEGGLLIDATGWRAVLACSVDPAFPAKAQVTYGLEKPARGFTDHGLHFYFDRDVRGDGYGWAFPAGDVSRAGVLSYVAAGGVKSSTEQFLAREGLHGDRTHGGYLTAGLRPATAGNVFLAGDSAGHCLPLTGEGIRPAAFFAQQLAGLVNRELAGAAGRAETVAAYSALQGRYAGKYRLLRLAQRGLRGWPDPPVTPFFRVVARQGRLYRWIGRRYWDIAAPIQPAAVVRRLREVRA